MNKNTYLLLLMLFFSILFCSCKKAYMAPGTNANNTNNTNNTAAFDVSGTWNITSFTQKTENVTSDFSGMDFTFSNDGKVKVMGVLTADGTWAYSPFVASYYGGPSSLATFRINIISGSIFAKLSRLWNVGINTTTSLQLDNPEASEEEHVIFTKK